jgi:hypothetical protein
MPGVDNLAVVVGTDGQRAASMGGVSHRRGLFDREILGRAAIDALRKFDLDSASPHDRHSARVDGPNLKRLAKYRQALDAGADALVVAGWMSEVHGERLRAEHELGAVLPGDKLTKEQIRTLVVQLRDIAKVLANADPKLKQEVYRELGVRVTYDPHQRRISVSAGPCTTECVEGGTCTFTTRESVWRLAV